MLTADINIQQPVKIKSTNLRKSGCSYTIRVPAFWVENENMGLGDELETYVSNGGFLILRKKPEVNK